jgi:A/G-specific adenine glycosylase
MTTGRAGSKRDRGAHCQFAPARPARVSLETIARRLLSWYERHRRVLPWRESGDPYAILVSEVMLQQTQVERVVPKYHEFLTRFPSFEALAAAPRAEVIRCWAPLGYNRRAVRLHEMAQRVVADFDGHLPGSAAELRTFAGLGPYSAGAVACFAFGEQLPVQDTNVRRVLGRLFENDLAAAGRPGVALTQLAEAVLPTGRAADWNQALMDYGATVCTARAPACQRCQLADLCQSGAAAASGQTAFARRVAEARPAYRAARPYPNSSRYYRGRIVEFLRSRAPGHGARLDEVGPAIRADYAPSDRAWLVALLDGLARDGLLVWREGDRGSAADRLVELP